jgi:hypothetical protein
MKNILPLLVIVSSVGLFFKDDVVSMINRNPIEVVDEIKITEEWKTKVSDIVEIIQKSEAKQDVKDRASDLWKASGDMWALSNASFNSNELVDFNQELLKVYGKQYPEIAGAFPGFGKAADELLSEIIGEYPTPMTGEKVKELSELCYAIAWAFKQ